MTDQHTPANEMLTAADRLDKLLEKADPLPWFFNTYSFVGSVPKCQLYNEWEEAISEAEPDHTWEARGECPVCGEWRTYDPGLLGHGCKLFDEDYRRESEVVHVRAHHGDTATSPKYDNAELLVAAVNASRYLPFLLRNFAMTMKHHSPEQQELQVHPRTRLGHIYAMARVINQET